MKPHREPMSNAPTNVVFGNSVSKTSLESRPHHALKLSAIISVPFSLPGGLLWLHFEDRAKSCGWVSIRPAYKYPKSENGQEQERKINQATTFLPNAPGTSRRKEGRMHGMGKYHVQANPGLPMSLGAHTAAHCSIKSARYPSPSPLHWPSTLGSRTFWATSDSLGI